MKAKPQDLMCNIGFYSLMPVAFVMQPKILEYQVENNGKQSKIEVLFYFNVRGAAGVYNVGKKRFLAQLVGGAVRVDGQLKTEFPHGLYLQLVEQKK